MMCGMRNHSRTFRAVTVILLLGAAACSDGEETPSDATPASDVSAINEIETCDNLDGRGVATGNIENLGTTTASYTIDLEFTDAATGEVLGSGLVAVRSVEPGEAAEWTIELEGVGSAELECASKSISAAG